VCGKLFSLLLLLSVETVVVVAVVVVGVAKSEIHFIYDRKQAESNRKST